MMIMDDVLGKFEQLAARYAAELGRYELEQLTRKPAEEEWSLGQMYMHLIRSTLNMQLANVEACRSGGDGVAVGGEKTEAGKYAFAMGGFRPVAIRVPPSPQYTPPQPADKDELARGLQQVLARMRALEPALAAIPAERTRPHPAFGALNAQEWFALVEMHFRHHLRQKAKLDAFLGVAPAGAEAETGAMAAAVGGVASGAAAAAGGEAASEAAGEAGSEAGSEAVGGIASGAAAVAGGVAASAAGSEAASKAASAAGSEAASKAGSEAGSGAVGGIASGAATAAGGQAAGGAASEAGFVPAGAGFITREPRFMAEEALTLAGIACRTALQNNASHSAIADAWTELHRRMSDIRGRVRPTVTLGLQEYPPEPFTATTAYTYVAAVLTDGSAQPDGFAERRVEASDYAVFTYRGPVAGFGGAFQYIYDTWLASSGCEPAAPFDFERYDERYTGMDRADSETDIYLPIRRAVSG